MNHPQPVTLVHVGEEETTGDGRLYFTARFKRGLFGKPVTRTFFSRKEDGEIVWERASPDDLRPLIGHDLSGEISIEPAEIEPEEFISSTTGEVHAVTSKAFVRFADETLEQAVRRSGSTLRAPVGERVSGTAGADTAAGVLAELPSGAFRVVGLNGQQAP